jgi:hypothetical protein
MEPPLRIATYRRSNPPGAPREIGLVSADGLTVTRLALDAAAAQRGVLGPIEALANGAPMPAIATGTPAGVGLGMTPPNFLGAGDVVRIEIDGLGAIEIRIVA